MSLAPPIQTPLTIEGGSTCQKSTHTESSSYLHRHCAPKTPVSISPWSDAATRGPRRGDHQEEERETDETSDPSSLSYPYLLWAGRELASPRSAFNIKWRLIPD